MRRRFLHWPVGSRVVVAGAIALLASFQSPAAQVTPLSPVARFFVLTDLGERTGDPIWQLQPSRIADGQDGYLYTTSTAGGRYGVGTVFKFPVNGVGTPPVVLYHFDTIHGAGPQGGLTRGSDGNFYGTTYRGGKYSAGTIFRITRAGALTVLWDFRNGKIVPAPVNRLPTPQEKLDAAGAFPVSAPIELLGTLYGVTSHAENQQYGVVYTLGTGGSYRGIYQFKPADVTTNGTYAVDLSVGRGSLWGTTLKGGLGWGTVYRATGTGISVIHKFNASYQGAMGVIEGSDGQLYGAATGSSTSFGRIYRLDPRSGTLTVIHCFDGTDGSIPVATPIQGSDGMLYGVTKAGGKSGRGVIYRLNPYPSEDHCYNPVNRPNQDADYKVLFNFNLNNGRYAVSPLIELPTPNVKGIHLYGVTYQGGTRDGGVAYKVNVRMDPKPAHDAIFQFGQRMSTDPMLILTKGVSAYQGTLDQAGLKASGGVSVQLLCPRDPHIVQFVMRTGTRADGTAATGSTYETSWGTFKYGEWHTDAIGFPNAYYDQSPGSAHRHDATSVTIFDAPSGGGGDAATARGWLFTARDFAICNGKVVRTASWAKGAAWDAAKGQLGPTFYTNFQVFAPAAGEDPTAWSNTQLQWINDHLRADGYDPVP